MKKIILRFKSLTQNKILFYSSVSLITLAFIVLPLFSSMIVKTNNSLTHSNVDDNIIFVDYRVFKRQGFDTILDKNDYSILTKTSTLIDNNYYYTYISNENINNFYLYFNKIYLEIGNTSLKNNYFYSNNSNLKTIELNGKIYKNSNEILNLNTPYSSDFLSRELNNIILIIDNDFQHTKTIDNNQVFINGNISDSIKDMLFNNNAYDGKTLKEGSKDQLLNITNLMSVLLLAPFVLITIIAFYIIDNLYEKNKLEDRIKQLFYNKNTYYFLDNLLDYLIIYFIPMLIGIIINLIITNILKLNVYTLFYMLTQFISLILLIIFVFRKRKIGKI